MQSTLKVSKPQRTPWRTDIVTRVTKSGLLSVDGDGQSLHMNSAPFKFKMTQGLGDSG